MYSSFLAAIAMVFVPASTYNFSIARSLALWARGFASSSVSSAIIGFFVSARTVGFFPQVHTGACGSQVQGCSNVRNNCYTILSSSE